MKVFYGAIIRTEICIEFIYDIGFGFQIFSM